LEQASLTVRGLTRVYETQYALDRLDAEFPSGQVTAVLGPNGAGKSTLIGILSTLMRPSEGEVCIDGSPVDLGAGSLRARIGYVGHRTMVYGNLTARENLQFFGALYGVDTLEQRAEGMLKRVGLEHDGDRPVSEFSRGMAQRLAIGRALISQPEFLLLDEPFTGLDQQGIELSLQLFTEAREQGAALILTSHDLPLVERIADRCLVLRRGRKRFEGGIQGRLSDVYQSALEGTVAK
jgi:heme exporter protein A